MGSEHLYIFGAVLAGLGATLITDLWGWFLNRAGKVPPPDFCLVGRWLRYMPRGRFVHAGIAATPKISAECVTGWIAHYVIGVLFALAFTMMTSGRWLDSPSLLPALSFGIGTVVFPFLIMQPSFGLGIAASKSPGPTRARLKSLMTHAVFGIGLYLSALPVSLLIDVSTR